MAPLQGLRILETAPANTPRCLLQCIAMTGRVAADFGADVRVARGMRDSFSAAEQAFLDHGKLPAEPGDTAAPDVILGTSDNLMTARVRVLFSAIAGQSDLPVTEFTVMARSGLLDIVGEPGREPLKLSGHQLAYATGLVGYTAMLAGLGRDVPSTLDLSMMETSVWLNWKSAAVAKMSGSASHRKGSGAEWQAVRCADGYVALVYEDADWPAIVALTGSTRLADPAFATKEGRAASVPEIAREIEAGLLSRTRAELRDIALARRLPFGPIWSVDDLPADRHMLARNFFETVDGRTLPRAPVLWNGQPPAATTEG